jgi:hypothetical protein
MVTYPPIPVQIGQVVCRRTEPLDTADIGVVGGLLFLSDRALAIVRWQFRPTTFEPEETLVPALRFRT